MVYLKPLYSRLDWPALRQSVQLSTEAKQQHVKILFYKMSNIFIIQIQECKLLSIFNKIAFTQTPKQGWSSNHTAY